MNLIKTAIPIVTIILIVVPALLIMSLNTKKSVRYKQLRFPVIAFIYSVLCCFLFSLLEKMSDWLFKLSFVIKFIEFISPSGKLEYISLVYTAIVLNVVILVAFFFVKGTFKVRVNKKAMPQKLEDLSGIKKIYWRFIDLFYNISNGEGSVHRCWVKISATLKYASWILSAVYIILMVFLQFPVFLNYSWIPYDFMRNCVKALYIWPVISFIVINELRWFLDGKKEFSTQKGIAFDHSSIYFNSEYGELVKQYEEQFPERFAGYYVAKAQGRVLSFHNDTKTESGLENGIKEQVRSGRYAEEERPQSGEYIINENYISCIRNISKGSNALIDASLFSDFGEYLFLYLNVLLSRGDNVLFICSDEESAEFIDRNITKKFKAINSFHPLWTIRNCKNAQGTTDSDILVLTPQSILDDDIFIGQTSFFDKLSTIVIVNTAEVLTKDGGLLALLVHKLTNIIRSKSFCRELHYICLSESIPLETVSTLKNVLNLHDELYLCDGYQSYDNTHLMLWNYESNNTDKNASARKDEGEKATLAQDNLFGYNSFQTYFGVSLPIACVGMKYKVNKISIMSKQSSPNLQIINSMSMQIGQMSKYFGIDNEKIDFNSTIILNSADREGKSSSFIIVEDELFNLPLAIYNYCRFGGTVTTILHIISKPYMLRDYFMANASQYINGKASINMLIPSVSDSSRTIVIKILYEALENGIKESELLERISAIAPNINNIDEALRFCRKIAFPDQEKDTLEHLFSFKTKRVFNSELVNFEENTYIYLRTNSSLKKIICESRHAKVEIHEKYFELGVPVDRLWQHFIPSQCIVFMGVIYKIESIDARNGIVHVTEASDRLDSPLEYIQVRKYKLFGETKISERITVPLKRNNEKIYEGYEVERFRSGVKVDTSAYYALEAFSPRLDLVHGVNPRELSDAMRNLMRREYESADILAIRIKNVGTDKSDKSAFLLSVILNEMLKTLFPYSYRCLAVCPVLNDRQAIYSTAMGKKIALAYPQVEFETETRHCAEDIEVLLIEDSQSDTGMLNSLFRDSQFPFRNIFENILEYLVWFNNYKCSGNITNKYLYFGSNTFPECFDVETLTEVFKKYETLKRLDPKIINRITSKGQCSYCHRDLFNVEYKEINDKAGKHNRKLCSECAELIVNDENELKELYMKTRTYLCDTFGITISNNIQVRFASAEKIRKRMKTNDQRVVVGFANPSKRELWVESDAPATNIMDVLVHELTHIWQFDNIKGADLVYIEGHASYVEIQYMRYEHRDSFADWQELSLTDRQDEYGEGFRRIREDLKEYKNTNTFSYMLEMFGK